MANENEVPLEQPVLEESLPPGAAETPMGTEQAPAPGETATASNLTITRDDIPELVDAQVGDIVSFEVSDISEDGNFSLRYMVPEQPEAPGAAAEPAAGGREGVLAALTGA